MDSYNVAEAKAHLSELIERAAAGEEIQITRRGEPMARLVPSERPKTRPDWAAIREAARRMTPYVDPDGLSFVERLRRNDEL